MTSGLDAGVDEAGRGPVIGPMVMAIAVLDKKASEQLKSMGVRDSKKMTAKNRQRMYPIVCELCAEKKTVHISPAKIDLLRSRMSLNQAEAIESAKLIMALKTNPKRVYVDSTDSVAQNYKKRIEDHMRSKYPGRPYPTLICEHRADDKYVQASAASVLAKVERDREIERLKIEWGDFGSGYPADPLTQKFISEIIKGGELPDMVRKSWNTVKKDRAQSSLDSFL